jgi:hypothetical protein
MTSGDQSEVNCRMSFLRNNTLTTRCQHLTRDISKILKSVNPHQVAPLRSQYLQFEKKNCPHTFHFLDQLIDEAMGDDDSTPPDDLSKSFSSTSERESGDGVSQTSGTSDSSWYLAKEETKQVNRSKVLLLGVLAIAAAVLGLCVFLVADEDEEDDFRAAVSSKLYQRLYTHCSRISRSSYYLNCLSLFLLFCKSAQPLVQGSFFRNHRMGPKQSA